MEDVLATVPVRRRRFTGDEFERMADAGIFGPEERVELIEGELVSRARSATDTRPASPR
jgi:hypothetical protein